MMEQTMLQPVLNYLLSLQDSICQQLEAVDGSGHFQQDEWQREQGGGGRLSL